MTGTFKANNPFNTFLLFVYGLLLKLNMFLHPVKPVSQPTDGFLFRDLLKQLEPVGNALPAIYPLISFILLLTQAITFNQFANRNRLMQKPNYLAAMAYLLVTSMFAEWSMLSSALIVNTLLIWVWSRMSALTNTKVVTGQLFNIGIAIGLATFFYFPSIAFTALIIFGLILTRPFRLAEWLVSLLGIIAPYYFLISYVFLTDKWKNYHPPGFSVSLPALYGSRWTLVAIIFIMLTTVVGIYYVRQNFRRQLVQTRKSWNLVLLYFFVAFFVPFINATHTFQYWVLCAAPLSALIGSAFFYPEKKWFPLIIHWLMVIYIIVFSYFIKLPTVTGAGTNASGKTGKQIHQTLPH